MHARVLKSAVVTPEDDWDANIRAICAYFEEHKHWPSGTDPVHGRFISRLNNQLKRINSEVCPRNSRKTSLTQERYQQVKKLGYVPYIAPNRVPANGFLAVVEGKLSRGEPLEKQECNQLRRLHINGNLGNKAVERIKALGFSF